MLPKSKAPGYRRQFQNSRCSRDRHKDIRLTEGDLDIHEMVVEKSAEVILVDRKRADIDNRRPHELMKD